MERIFAAVRHYYHFLNVSEALIIPDEINGVPVVAIGESILLDNADKAIVKSIQIGNNVQKIGDYAFLDFENVLEVTIPKTVTEIGDYAFGYYVDDSVVSDADVTVHAVSLQKIDGFKIYCYAGTASEQYAIDNGFDYVLLDDSSISSSSEDDSSDSSSKTASTSSTATPSTGAAAGLGAAALGLAALVVTKRKNK